MALLQKKPQLSTSTALYTLGSNKTTLLVGLGNAGKKYEKTRHNIGFRVLDAFAENQEFSNWIERKDLQTYLTTKNIGSNHVIIMKPTTMMNLSGEAVQKVANFYKVSPDHILAIHDELDIPFGQIRTRIGGSSAGHNGIKSLIQQLGKEFGRIRIGIGPKTPEQIDSADFVLAKFSDEQEAEMAHLYQESVAIITEYLFGEYLPSETRSFLI